MRRRASFSKRSFSFVFFSFRDIHSFGFSFQFPKKRGGFPLSLVSQFTLNLNLYRTDWTLLVSLSLSVTRNHSNGFRRYNPPAQRVKKYREFGASYKK
jgi:hypothetical protein